MYSHAGNMHRYRRMSRVFSDNLWMFQNEFLRSITLITPRYGFANLIFVLKEWKIAVFLDLLSALVSQSVFIFSDRSPAVAVRFLLQSGLQADSLRTWSRKPKRKCWDQFDWRLIYKGWRWFAPYGFEKVEKRISVRLFKLIAYSMNESKIARLRKP